MKFNILLCALVLSGSVLASGDYYELEDKFENQAINTSRKFITNDNYECEQVGLLSQIELKNSLRIKKYLRRSNKVKLNLAAHKLDQLVLEQIDSKTFSFQTSALSVELRKIKRGELIIKLTESNKITFFDCELEQNDNDWFDFKLSSLLGFTHAKNTCPLSVLLLPFC